MEVLIIEFDLFTSMGGAQTFYRRLIQNNPDCTYSFLTKSLRTGSQLPANCRPIPYRRQYPISEPNNFEPAKWLNKIYTEALNIAASVRGRSFDVVEVPDYSLLTIFLPDAFERFGVKAGKILQVMHGRLSTSFVLNHDRGALRYEEVEFIREIERLNFRAADLRYGISEYYLESWERETGVTAHCYDPLNFVTLQDPLPPAKIEAATPVPLFFLGRKEHLKAPDLAVEMAWELGPEVISKVIVAGPSTTFDLTRSFDRTLIQHASHRGVQLEIPGKLEFPQAHGQYSDKSILVLPSRSDSLNLSALEGLLSGWPLALSERTGAVRYLRQRFKDIGFLVIDPDRPNACLADLKEIAQNFTRYRQELLTQLKGADLAPDLKSLHHVYEGCSEAKRDMRADELVEQARAALNPNQISFKKLAVARTKFEAVRVLKSTSLEAPIKNGFELLRQLNRKGLGGILFLAVQALSKRLGVYEEVRQILQLIQAFKRSITWFIKAPEATDSSGPLSTLVSAATKQCRVPLHKILFERAIQNQKWETAAAYGLRIIRWSEDAPPELQDKVQACLNKAGYAEEARILPWIANRDENSAAASLQYLQSRLEQEFEPPPCDFEAIEDRRSSAPPRVSVIVSLYNTRGKLDRFLRYFRSQSLVRKGNVELILIDSQSPHDELLDLQSSDTNGLSFFYARTPKRETIQTAWNRGIQQARGEYLVFLGVDESLKSCALEALANHLDNNPETDWVTASAVVSEVTPEGDWVEDSFFYDRSGFEKPLQYLDTCYVNFVGGMYRRSIHDRFGYYDGSFKAAGDTEFKLRILPFVNVHCLKETLGIFWNYPEERVTQSPRAEIEDLRAWYLFRTMGGLLYAYPDSDEKGLSRLLELSLSFRKSYRSVISTDLLFARDIVKTLSIKKIATQGATARLVVSADQQLRRMDGTQPGDLLSLIRGQVRLWRTFRSFRIATQSAAAPKPPKLDPFYDNRYDQHTDIWA